MNAKIKVLSPDGSYLEASISVSANLADLPEQINKVQNLWLVNYGPVVDKIVVVLTPNA